MIVTVKSREADSIGLILVESVKTAGHLIGIMTAERIAVPAEPIGQPGRTQRRAIHEQSVLHQTPDLLARDHNIADQQAEEPATPVPKPRWNA